MSTIEKALLEATKQKAQKAGEDRQKFLERVMLAVGKLKDDEWEALAKADGAQEWYNGATEADNAKKAIPDFADAEEPEDDAGSADEADADDDAEEDDAGGEAAGDEGGKDEEDDVPEKSAKKKAAGKGKEPAGKKSAAPAAKAGAKKPVKETPTKKAAAPAPKKGTSMRRTLKMIIAKRPKMSVEDLIEALEKKGYKSPSKLTVSSFRADTRDTMKVLVEAGLLDVEM